MSRDLVDRPTTARHEPTEDPSSLGLLSLEALLCVLGVLGATAVALDLAGPIRAGLAGAAVALVPGYAVVRHVPAVRRSAALVLTLCSSAVIVTIAGLAMVWSRIWLPDESTVLLLLAAAASMFAVPGPRHGLSRLRVPRPSLGVVAPWATLAVAVGLWAISLPSTSVARLDQWGLLTAIPLTWYAGLIIAFGVCVWSVTRLRARTAAAGGGLVTLIVMLFATSSALEAFPRFSWTYKHVNVTEFIDRLGGVDPSVDLYNRWPGFFAGAAVLKRAMGVEALTLARWSEVTFALVFALFVYAIGRALGLAADRAVLGALVFTLLDWIGAVYFSPQAFAFALYLGLVLVLLTFLRREPGPRMLRLERWIGGTVLRGTSPSLRPASVPVSVRGRVVAASAVIILQAVIVASHQLTPYAAIAAVLPLAALGWFAPRWLGVALLVLTLAYLLPNFDYIQERWGVTSGFNPFGNAIAAPGINVSLDGPAAHIKTFAADALTIFGFLLGAAGWIRRARSGDVRTALIVAWLGVATALILIVQDYGGEGRLRVVLFAAPWLAIGVVWLFTPSAKPSRRRLLVAALSIMLALAVFVDFQPEGDNAQNSGEIRAARHLDSITAQDDVIVGALPFLPSDVGPNYRHVTTAASTYWSVYFAGRLASYTSADDVVAFRRVAEIRSNVFVLFSTVQSSRLRTTDPRTASALDELQRSIVADPRFHQVYANAVVSVYELPRSV